MPLVPGVAFGQVFAIRRSVPRRRSAPAPAVPVNPDEEIERFRASLGQLKQDLRFVKDKVSKDAGPEEGRLFEVQVLMLDDPTLLREVEGLVRRERMSLESAIERLLELYEARFAEIDDPHLRDKFADVADVLSRVRDRSWLEKTRRPVRPSGPQILVAEEILPSAILTPEGNPFDGIVTVVGGLGSHAAVLAKAYGVPVVGVSESAIKRIMESEHVLVDGQEALVYADPPSTLVDELLTKRKRFEDYKRRVIADSTREARTTDGEIVRVHANCGTVAQLSEARAHGGDGVGLLRTEFVFYTHTAFPTEEEQVEIYRQAVAAFEGRPVTIRTLDIGGDKVLPYFLLPKQLNPYLGWRSLKISFDHPAEFKTQIKAILRAAFYGDVRILFPMVTTFWDGQRCREFMLECEQELEKEGKPFKAAITCGATIETPAAVVRLEDIAESFDFLAVGSNDLTQYVLAVDRDNPRVSEFYIPHHPAVTGVLKEIVARCRRIQKPVSLCGEMASNADYLLLLVGLGFRELSVAPTFIPICKDIIRCLDASEAASVAEEAVSLKTGDEAIALLKTHLRRCYPDADQLVG